MKPRMLRIDQVADRMNVSQMTVRRWVEQGIIFGTKVGGCIRVDAESLDKAIEQGEAKKGSNEKHR